MLKEEGKKVKIKFLKKLEELSFKTRLEVTDAFRSRSEQKKLNANKHNFVYFDSKEVHKLVKEFDEEYRVNLESHKEIKKENDIFLNKYNNAKKKTALKKDNSSENIFSELMLKYKEKGYHNVRDIKQKTNLFEVSPLLLPNNKVLDFYKLGDNYKHYSKDLDYTRKLKKMVNEKFLNDGRVKTVNNKQRFKFEQLKTEPNYSNKMTMKDIVKEMQLNEDSIKQAINILANKELKTMFSEFNNHSTQTESNSDTHNRTTQDLGKSNLKFLVTSKTINKSHETKKRKQKNTDVNKKSLMGITSSYLIESEGNDLDGLNHTPIKRKNQSKYSSSLFSLMKDNFKSNLSVKKQNKKRLNLSEMTISNVIDDEKRKIKDKIEAKINIKKIPELEKIQEKINNKESVNKDIIDYLVDKVGRDRTSIEDGLKKKIGPNDIMKYIADLKSKVLLVDFNESYKNFSSKLGNWDINMNNLAKIR